MIPFTTFKAQQQLVIVVLIDYYMGQSRTWVIQVAYVFMVYRFYFFFLKIRKPIFFLLLRWLLLLLVLFIFLNVTFWMMAVRAYMSIVMEMRYDTIICVYIYMMTSALFSRSPVRWALASVLFSPPSLSLGSDKAVIANVWKKWLKVRSVITQI